MSRKIWIQLTLLYVTLIRLWACPRNTLYVEQDSTHNLSQAGSFVNTFVGGKQCNTQKGFFQQKRCNRTFLNVLMVLQSHRKLEKNRH